jgi:hypothetical protein
MPARYQETLFAQAYPYKGCHRLLLSEVPSDTFIVPGAKDLVPVLKHQDANWVLYSLGSFVVTHVVAFLTCRDAC